MFNHPPADYVCPICRLVAGGEDEHRKQHDVVRRDELATAFVSPRWWPKNHGHVLVVPNVHDENLYDLPSRYGHAVHDLARDIAIAIRQTYGCDGTSLRQHNEPAGNQDRWHYHMHVFPRYTGDDLYFTRPEQDFAPAEQRLPFADKLRGYSSRRHRTDPRPIHDSVPARPHEQPWSVPPCSVLNSDGLIQEFRTHLSWALARSPVARYQAVGSTPAARSRRTRAAGTAASIRSMYRPAS